MLPEDPPKLGNAIQHRALLLHALGVIVDLAGTICSCFLLAAWKAFRDPSVIKAEIARQGRRSGADRAA